MNRLQRALIKAVAGEDAVKALTRPAWWGDVWNTNALGEGGVYGNTPAGWRGAVNSNVWAYNSVKARMSLVAQAPMKLFEGTGDERKEIEKHPVLDLLKEVNPVNLNARSFMRGIEQQLSIYGRCVVHKNRAVGVKELFILPMEFVEPVPDERTWLAGFTWLPTGEFIPREDVVDFYYPSANGSVYADSPAAVALGSVNRYNLADKAQASIDRRGGQKGGLVIHPKDEISEDFHRTRDEWDRLRSNPDNAGRDMHVPFGTAYDGNAFTATEMQREERNQRLAKEIMAAFSVPPAAAGDYRDASVLANAATQMSTFWTLWGMDELKFIAEELTYSLLWAEYPDAKKKGYYFEHDLSDIPALREDADALANRAIVLYQGGLASLNEAREVAGLDAVDDPAGDEIPALQQAEPPAEEATTEDGESVMNDTLTDDVEDDPELDALSGEVDDLLDELEGTAAKALGRPEKGDMDGDGIFNEGSKPAGGKVSPVTGRSLAAKKDDSKPSKEDKERERAKKKAETQRQREQKKAEAAKRKEEKAAAKKKAQIAKLDEEGMKLQAAYDSIKDRADVSPKLKQKVIDTMAKVRAKRDALATGNSEATSSVLQDIARIPGKAFMPVVDFVGMDAVDSDGNALGTIEKIHRFGTFDGIEATKAVPVVVIDGRAFSAGDVNVVVEYGEEADDQEDN